MIMIDLAGTLNLEIGFTLIIGNIDIIAVSFWKVQQHAITHHAGKNEMHVFAKTVFFEH